MRRLSSMATKDFSTIQENMVADYLGWEVVTGSGARACFPGDVTSDIWLGECKTHIERGQKIFFGSSVWTKIQDEAMAKRRCPVLIVDDGSQKSEHTWCLLSVAQVDDRVYTLHPPIKVTTKNITTSHELLGTRYKSIPDNELICYEWDKQKVCVVPLEIFRQMTED